MHVSPMPHSPASRQPAPARRALPWLLLGLACIAFALLAFETALSLALGRPPLATAVQGWLVSQDFAYGPRSVHALMTALYAQALPAMSLHLVLGATALAFGVSQFVPSLRRRHPLMHRICGRIAATAIALSMSGAIAFLVFVPMQRGYSGPAFHIGLWALSLLTLFTLTQAVLAIVQRDLRSHMVWMTITFAAIATAPMLRVDWAVLARLLGWNQERVNLAGGVLVLSETLLLGAAWLSTVGDRDLPAQPRPTRWPMLLIRLFAFLAGVVALHEGVLAPWGLDLLSGLRPAADRMPATALAWAVGTAAVAWGSPVAWQALLHGAPPPRSMVAAGALAGAGAIAMGLGYPAHSMAAQAQGVFWVGFGVLSLLMLALAVRASPHRMGRNAWGVQWLFIQWLPSQWPGLWLLGLLVGATFGEAMAAALAVGIGGLSTMGIATAFGASLRFKWVRAPRTSMAE